MVPVLIACLFFSVAFVLYRYDDALTRVMTDSTPLNITIFAGGLVSWAVILAFEVRRHRSERRKARFAACQCVRCGYDLRATANRCPECGEVPSSHRDDPPLPKTSN